MKYPIRLLLLIVFLTTTNTTFSQTVNAIPSDETNDRFAQEYFSVIRPGLSLNGFDNTGDEPKGLGLKQVLNTGLSGNTYVKDKLNSIFLAASSSLEEDNPTNDETEENSRILQYTAFEALASYVLEHNDIDSVTSESMGLTIRSHAVAVADLRAKLLSVSNAGWDNLVTNRDDFVKNVKSYQNVARAVDLYLALENAYEAWNPSEWSNLNSTILLGEWEKKKLNQLMREAIGHMHGDLYSFASPLAILFGVEEYEVEPGNRPLKGFLALGLTTLAVQDPFFYPYGTTNGDAERADYDFHLGLGSSDWFRVHPNQYFNEARDKASAPATNNNSVKYWMYQSSDGNKEWAEGPYYLDYALADAIPFWHAVRINGLLGTVPDPFDNDNRWFLNPVEWLADISTPDGYIPPIDDGNKFRLRNTDLLRWNNTYGDNKVGGKFATVYHNTLKFYGTAGEPYNFNNYQYLIDIAIPKRVVGDTVGLPPKITKASNPQYLIRHTDSVGDDHYLLFNKETGNDITRGEGHEQPDQMQILYYINDDSYIVDGGYDAGGQKINSTWNGYIYHNLMHYSYNYLSTHHDGYVEYQNFGGLESPKVVVTKSRKVSEHGDVTSARFRNISDNLKAIEGEVTLSMHNAPSGYIEADYKRRLVMVLGNSPYIVDFNKIEEGYMPQQPDNNIIQKMHYYGNSNSLIM